MGRRNLQIEERKKIAQLLESDYTPKEIAVEISCSESTIYGEIKRGSKDGKYDPLYAQKEHEQKLRQRGSVTILSKNEDLANYIAFLLLQKHLSPESVVQELKKDKRYSGKISTSSIYNAIRKGYIPGVNAEKLHHSKTKMFSNGLLKLPAWAMEKYGYSDGDQFDIQINEDTIVFYKSNNT